MVEFVLGRKAQIRNIRVGAQHNRRGTRGDNGNDGHNVGNSGNNGIDVNKGLSVIQLTRQSASNNLRAKSIHASSSQKPR